MVERRRGEYRAVINFPRQDLVLHWQSKIYLLLMQKYRKTCRIRLVAKGKSRVQTRTSGRRKLVKIDFITTSGNVKGTEYGRPISSLFYNIPEWVVSHLRYFCWYYFSEILPPFIPSQWFTLIKSFFLQKYDIFIHFRSIL